MRNTRKLILVGAAAAVAASAGTAAAAEAHRMNVALPDGSVAQIEYEGDVAPRVIVVPATARSLAAYDPFADFDRIAARMEAQRQAMLLRMAALQKAAAEAAAAQPGGMTVVGNLPAGARYTMVSSTTDANGCTQTVRYSSDGSSETPQVTRASAGNCQAVPADPAATLVNATSGAEPQSAGERV